MTPRRQPRARGFALAVVIILAAIVVLVSGIMIQRHGAARLNVDRELARYEAHHAGRGLTESIWAWVQTIPSDGVREMIGEDGHAFDMHFGDGTTVSVTVRDGQGSLMVNAAELPTRERDDAAEILEHLRTIVGPNVPEEYTRQVGPLKMSALTAPKALLEAVVMQANEGEGSSEFVDTILDERTEESFRDASISQAMSRAGLSPQTNSRLRRLLTAEPTLWIVRAEITPRGAREPTDAYEGTALIETRGGRRGISSFSPWGPFLSWERVDPRSVP